MLYISETELAPFLNNFTISKIYCPQYIDIYTLALNNCFNGKDYIYTENAPMSYILTPYNNIAAAKYIRSFFYNYSVEKIIAEYIYGIKTEADFYNFLENLSNNSYYQKFKTFLINLDRVILENDFTDSKYFDHIYVNEFGIYNEYFIEEYLKLSEVNTDYTIFGKFILLSDKTVRFFLRPNIVLLQNVENIIAADYLIYKYRDITYKTYFIIYTPSSNLESIRIKYVNSYIDFNIDEDISYMKPQNISLKDQIPKVIFNIHNIAILKNENCGLTIQRPIEYTKKYFQNIVFGHIKEENQRVENLNIYRETLGELLNKFADLYNVNNKDIFYHSPNVYTDTKISVLNINPSLYYQIKAITYNYLIRLKQIYKDEIYLSILFSLGTFNNQLGYNSFFIYDHISYKFKDKVYRIYKNVIKTTEHPFLMQNILNISLNKELELKPKAIYIRQFFSQLYKYNALTKFNNKNLKKKIKIKILRKETILNSSSSSASKIYTKNKNIVKNYTVPLYEYITTDLQIK